jgi:hypothetical protein
MQHGKKCSVWCILQDLPFSAVEICIFFSFFIRADGNSLEKPTIFTSCGRTEGEKSVANGFITI